MSQSTKNVLGVLAILGGIWFFTSQNKPSETTQEPSFTKKESMSSSSSAKSESNYSNGSEKKETIDLENDYIRDKSKWISEVMTYVENNMGEVRDHATSEGRESSLSTLEMIVDVKQGNVETFTSDPTMEKEYVGHYRVMINGEVSIGVPQSGGGYSFKMDEDNVVITMGNVGYKEVHAEVPASLIEKYLEDFDGDLAEIKVV